MRRVRPWLVVTLLMALTSTTARADDTPCAPDDAVCRCAADDNCWAWERIYSGPDALLGVRGTIALASAPGEAVDGAVSTTYGTERYVTVNEISAHLAASGTIGGGTAGTDGSVSASGSVGWRVPSTPTRGLFARAGLSGLLLGNERLSLALIEPVQAKVGFQVIEAGLLFEGGVSAGFVGAGRFAPPGGTGDDLARSGEVGTFIAAHVGLLRLSSSLQYLPSWLTADGVTFVLARAALCARPGGFAICGDVLYASGTSQSRRGDPRRPSVLHSGLTVGVTP
jgi:hypothetical protein